MGNFSEFILGYRDWLKKEAIIEFVRNSINFNKGGGETINNAKAILLYTNSNQQSWLVKTNKRIYKILDDKRKLKPSINWSVKKEKFVNRTEQPNINIQTYKRDIDKIIFGFNPEKEYLLDKKLFANIDFNDVINAFIKD